MRRAIWRSACWLPPAGPVIETSVLVSTSMQLTLTTFFVGDDQSDEKVFSSLGPLDVSIKVGGGPTGAMHRLHSPTEVVVFLRTLAELRRSEDVSTDEP